MNPTSVVGFNDSLCSENHTVFITVDKCIKRRLEIVSAELFNRVSTVADEHLICVMMVMIVVMSARAIAVFVVFVVMVMLMLMMTALALVMVMMLVFMLLMTALAPVVMVLMLMLMLMMTALTFVMVMMTFSMMITFYIWIKCQFLLKKCFHRCIRSTLTSPK